MTKLYRSQRDKKVFGLCGGLAETFNIDATILRVIVAAGVIFSGGTVLLLYIVASLVIPKEPGLYNGHPHSGYGSQGWNPPGPGMSTPNGHTQAPPPQSAPVQAAPPSIDDMMKDIEKKAMQNEIDQLKARLAKLEKGDE
ncbi:MAG: PspC domain-containing protein [Paenibacillaceae bacterium]